VDVNPNTGPAINEKQTINTSVTNINYTRSTPPLTQLLSKHH